MIGLPALQSYLSYLDSSRCFGCVGQVYKLLAIWLHTGK